MRVRGAAARRADLYGRGDETCPGRVAVRDASVTLAAGIVSVGGHVLTADPGASTAGIAVVAGGAASLALRRALPLTVLALTGISAAVVYLLGEPHMGPFIIVPVLVAIYTVSSAGRRVPAVVATMGMVAILGAGPFLPGSTVDPIDVLWGVGWLVASMVTGEVIHERRRYLDEVEARAVEAERTRDEEARRRATEERLRIAREFHDVVAHNISMINVQATTAAHLLESEPDRAGPTLETIKEASRETLAELRTALGVLRRTDEGHDGGRRSPAPGIDRLDALVERADAAGLSLDLRIGEDQRPLPKRVDLTAYRIVQEALTNTLRHAGTANAVVSIDYGEDTVDLRIDDDGCGGPPAGDGYGLVGMRERAAMLGGELHAGPGPHGGFRVEASLPTSDPGSEERA